VFDDLFFVDFSACIFCFVLVVFSPGSNFDFFSFIAKRLARKSVSYMTYLVSSGMLFLNSVNMAG